jgi:hypothetical protein
MKLSHSKLSKVYGQNANHAQLLVPIGLKLSPDRSSNTAEAENDLTK